MNKSSPYDKHIGKRFGRLVAIRDLGMIRRNPTSTKKTHFFLFKCDCGREKMIAMSDVLKGKITSCGCLRHELNLKSKGRSCGNPKHGDCYKKIYQIYNNIKGKCYNKNNKSYSNFGGIGITICDEWENDYIKFREWSYANGYQEKGNNSLCRKDLNKGFSPDNCFFSTVSYNKRHALSDHSIDIMKGKANAWRKENKETIKKYIRKGIETKIKKYGKLAVSNRQKATWKCGWRTISGTRIFFRSRWEANYGRYLQALKESKQIKDWIYEPKTFIFKDGKTFLPDFEVINYNGSIEYHEVKGWNDERSKHHLQAMREDFPNEKLIVIFSKQYKDITREFSKKIEGWEK